MNSYQRCCVAIATSVAFLGLAVRAAEPPLPHVSLLDNLYLNATTGFEKPPGEDSTPFGQFGANWAIPVTQPDALAVGLQLGSNLKFRDHDPEWNSTFGVFTRPACGDQQGLFAVLFDYRRTAFHNHLWAVRPIIGTTITDRDALGIEGVAALNHDRREKIIDQFTTFWTRDWRDNFATELGIGYQFARVDEALFRGRCAIGLSESISLAMGGDINTAGNYALGVGVSYHFGGTGRSAHLHQIGGTGAAAYTPLPDSSFPTLVHRVR